MAPLTQTVLPALLVLLGTSSCTPLPAASPNTDNTFSFRVGNFSASVPLKQCFGGASKSVVEGPAQFKKCIPLGDTYTAFIIDSIGTNVINHSARCWFLTNEDCTNTGGAEQHDFFEDGSLKNMCLESAEPFSAVLYTNVCNHGSGGKL